MLKSTHIAAVGGFILAAALASADANALTVRTPDIPIHNPPVHVTVPQPGPGNPCRACTGVGGAGFTKKIGTATNGSGGEGRRVKRPKLQNVIEFNNNGAWVEFGPKGNIVGYGSISPTNPSYGGFHGGWGDGSGGTLPSGGGGGGSGGGGGGSGSGSGSSNAPGSGSGTTGSLDQSNPDNNKSTSNDQGQSTTAGNTNDASSGDTGRDTGDQTAAIRGAGH